MTKFWTFNQNNSGGHFTFDEDAGITHFVVIEAVDVDHANARAQSIGLYFGGFGDCPCCGDRWSPAWKDEGEDEPKVYDMPVSEYAPNFGRGWMEEGKEIAVHRLNAPVEWYGCVSASDTPA